MAIIQANKEDIGENVITVGNLNRQKTVNSLLTGVKQVNEFAGYYAYTGKYNGEKVTTVFHGIGTPSMALISNDLASLGAKKIVRFGSGFSVTPDLKAGELAVVMGYSYNPNGTFYQYLKDNMSIALTPDYSLLRKLTDNLDEKSLKYRAGNVFTSDALQAHDSEFIKKLDERNQIAVELEGAGLYFMAGIKKFKTVSMHLIYGNLATNESLSPENINKTEKEAAQALIETIID